MLGNATVSEVWLNMINDSEAVMFTRIHQRRDPEMGPSAGATRPPEAVG